MKTWNVLEAWYDKNGRRGGDKFIGTVKDDNEAGAIAKARRTYAVGDEIKVYAPTLKVGMKVKRTEFKSAKPFKITDTKPDGYILVPTPDDMRGTIAEAFRMYEHERHFERV